MVCCLLFFDDGPVDGDPRAAFEREWETGLQDAPCASPTFCCCGLLCPGCTAYYLRQQVLGGRYRGDMGEIKTAYYLWQQVTRQQVSATPILACQPPNLARWPRAVHGDAREVVQP